MKAVCVAEQLPGDSKILHSYGNQEDKLELEGEEADPVDSDAALYALIGVQCSANSNDQQSRQQTFCTTIKKGEGVETMQVWLHISSQCVVSWLLTK